MKIPVDNRPRPGKGLHAEVMEMINDGLPFRRADAGRLGLTTNVLARAVATGRLHRPFRGCYVDSAVPDTRELRLSCLVPILPERAIVWGRTAAWLWGIDSFSPGEQDLLVPEFAVPHHRGRPSHPDIRVVEAYLPVEAVTQLNGIRVTTPARTALDLARRLRRPMALAALDAFTHTGLVTPAELRVGVARLRHHPGVRQARVLVALVEPATESPGESWLRLRIVDAGFPRPEPQIRLYDPSNRERYRLDLGYRDDRLGLEYDGQLFHDAPAQQKHDRIRREDIERTFGWTVYGFGRGDVLGTYPSVELTVGEMLSMEPRLPRRW
jgi:hypothetical protein